MSLNELYEAIREKRAYLKTFVGNRLVVGYNDATGDCVTNNTGSEWDRRTFLVCRDAIQVAARPVLEVRRVVKHRTFEFQGQTCQATSHEIERVWHWPEKS